MKYWWCIECQERVGLNRQGKCETCDSEGVDSLSGEEKLNHSDSAISSD